MMKVVATTVTAAATGAAVYFGRSYYLSNTATPFIVGGFNMQYGPYKISRVAPNTTGLDSYKKMWLLTFNKYCTGKHMEDLPLTDNAALQTIFGLDSTHASYEYEVALTKCLRWKQDIVSNKWTVDVDETFKTYFDPVNHHLWTSAIIDTTAEVSQEILSYGVDVMALVETSAGIYNSNNELIPHTDNLVKLLENLNKGQDLTKSCFGVASYAQFSNPVAKTFPQLNRGNAIIYNAATTKHFGSFVIEISSEKRGQVTIRRYPVCLFGQSEPTVMVCAAHVSGYSYSDSQKKENSRNIEVGDTELDRVLKVLNGQFFDTVVDVTVAINGISYKTIDPVLPNLLKYMKVHADLPIVVIGDFNQDFNKNSITYPHKYRYPTFIPHEGETIAERNGFQNGYISAKQINPTTGYGATIDGFLTKNIKNVTLISKPFDPKNSTSDHSAIYAKL